MSATELFFLDLIDNLANGGLELDPQSAARLLDLEDRMVRIETTVPDAATAKPYTLKVTAGRLELMPNALPEPNVILKGTPIDLGAWLLSGGSSRGVEVEGDDTVLQEFLLIVQNFRPDLEGPLARIIGEQPSQDLLGAAELAFATFRSMLDGAGTSLKKTATTHLADEARFNGFLDRMDDASLRVDRLKARIATLETDSGGTR